VRLIAFGDSFVAGAGDPDHQGWIGRALVGRREVTLYNLGVRRETSGDIAARWRREAEPRLAELEPNRIVFSFGNNDCHMEPGAQAPRVTPAQALNNAQAMLTEAAALCPALLVGPPPVADRAQWARTRALNASLQALCGRLKVPFIDVHARLEESDGWLAEAAAWDGAHPGAQGYQQMADLVAGHPAWLAFLEPA
jgi:lysophospholipase L1-like esterase